MSLATRPAAHPYSGNVSSRPVRKRRLTSLDCDGNSAPQGGGAGFRVPLFMQRERNCRSWQLNCCRMLGVRHSTCNLHPEPYQSKPVHPRIIQKRRFQDHPGFESRPHYKTLGQNSTDPRPILKDPKNRVYYTR